MAILTRRGFLETFERLASTLESVDVRVAAYRVREKGKSIERWHVTAATIRVSARSPASVRERHEKLGRRLGPPNARNYVIALDAFPLTAIPVSSDGRIVAPVVENNGKVMLGLYTGRGPDASLTRARQCVIPWDSAHPHPAFEYMYQLPEETQYEERLPVTLAELEELARAYLELNPRAAPRGGIVYVEVESPAWIEPPTVSGASVGFKVVGPPSAAGMRALLERRDRGTGAVYERVSVTLEGSGPEWDGLGAFEILGNEDVLRGVLTHPELGELDVFSEEVPTILAVAERNPLLTCLSQFWDLENDLYSPLLKSGTKPPPRDTRTPQRAFQASVCYLLTLAGVPTIDLGEWDKLFAPGSKVELGTADLLGFHAPTRILVVGACTIGVPRPQDADTLLNVVNRLRVPFPPESGVRLIPAIFSGQHGEPATRGSLAEHGIRLFNHDDLERLRALIETGRHEALIAYLNGEEPRL